MSLDSGLSAESTDVSCVLGDFHLLDLLSERGTVSVERDSLATQLLLSPMSVATSYVAFSRMKIFQHHEATRELWEQPLVCHSASINCTKLELSHTWYRIYR
jgi:hypothetical protein